MQQTSIDNNIRGNLGTYLENSESTRTKFDGQNYDMHAELSQKDNDLILAAQLGKALLEKNDELSKENERLTEEYSFMLEELEQEKYSLKRKLDALEGEYDTRVADLEIELNELRKELDEHKKFVVSTEKEKYEVVQELQDENQRLTEVLNQTTKSEELLCSQVESLHQQFNRRRSSLTDHVSQLEGLREEVDMLMEKKTELERRIQELIKEKERLNLSLEDSNNRILILDKHRKEQDQQIRNHKRDLEKLKQTNSELQDKLDSSIDRSSTTSFGQMSIYREIEMLSTGDEFSSLNSSQCDHSRQFSHLGSSLGSCGDVGDELSPCTGVILHASEENWKFRQELVEIYHQLLRVSEDLKRRRDTLSKDRCNSPSPDDIQVHDMRIDTITRVLQELRLLLQDLFVNHAESPCIVCQPVENGEIEKIHENLVEKTDELTETSREINELTTKISVQEAELSALKEERDRLLDDIGNAEVGKDEVVRKAFDVRDKAVSRKNALEIELAKTRINVMHINSQLMEAINQKLELSQQVEQWQDDVQSLLDCQLKAKLNYYEESGKPQAPSKAAQKSRGKQFKLWS
ncbi:BICD family-like cargo adapter 1 [Tachypleus tridentatus]|uniref:BICD family-like cargo adapter 1 n=1 Tax=Tachypleus tridentatus TaxID=6853 RepID=UPI003FD6A1CE